MDQVLIQVLVGAQVQDQEVDPDLALDQIQEREVVQALEVDQEVILVQAVIQAMKAGQDQALEADQDQALEVGLDQALEADLNQVQDLEKEEMVMMDHLRIQKFLQSILEKISLFRVDLKTQILKIMKLYHSRRMKMISKISINALLMSVIVAMNSTLISHQVIVVVLTQ